MSSLKSLKEVELFLETQFEEILTVINTKDVDSLLMQQLQILTVIAARINTLPPKSHPLVLHILQATLSEPSLMSRIIIGIPTLFPALSIFFSTNKTTLKFEIMRILLYFFESSPELMKEKYTSDPCIGSIRIGLEDILKSPVKDDYKHLALALVSLLINCYGISWLITTQPSFLQILLRVAAIEAQVPLEMSYVNNDKNISDSTAQVVCTSLAIFESIVFYLSQLIDQNDNMKDNNPNEQQDKNNNHNLSKLSPDIILDIHNRLLQFYESVLVFLRNSQGKHPPISLLIMCTRSLGSFLLEDTTALKKSLDITLPAILSLPDDAFSFLLPALPHLEELKANNPH